MQMGNPSSPTQICQKLSVSVKQIPKRITLNFRRTSSCKCLALESECYAIRDLILSVLISELGFHCSCAAMELVFGGKVEHLRPFLLEERIPDGWVPWNRKRYGITMGAFNVASTKIGLRTKTVPPTMVATPISDEVDAK